MYEYRYGGLWLRWGALSAEEKKQVLLIGILVTPASLLIGLFAGDALYPLAYGLGYLAGSGGSWPDRFGPTLLDGWSQTRWFGIAVPVSLALSALATPLWIRFSRAQDELFNRVQNYGIAFGAVAAIGLFLVWTMLAAVGHVPAFHAPVLLLFWFVMTGWGFMRATRKWA